MDKLKNILICCSDEEIANKIGEAEFCGVSVTLDSPERMPGAFSFDAVMVVGNEEDPASAVFIKKWVGHNHLRCIEREKSPEKTVRRISEEIEFYANSKYEIEKKFLIKKPDVDFLENLEFCRGVYIEQAYLKEKNGAALRIRKRVENSFSQHFLTAKKQITDITREEYEEVISEERYKELLKEKSDECEVISKKRYCLVHGGKYFEIDIFPFMKEKALLEVELNDEQERFAIPRFIEIIKDVTAEKDYTNFNMSKKLKTNAKFYDTL